MRVYGMSGLVSGRGSMELLGTVYEREGEDHPRPNAYERELLAEAEEEKEPPRPTRVALGGSRRTPQRGK